VATRWWSIVCAGAPTPWLWVFRVEAEQHLRAVAQRSQGELATTQVWWEYESSPHNWKRVNAASVVGDKTFHPRLLKNGFLSK
jgi:hypothetical protein